MNSSTILITGASSGIGYDMARLFAAEKKDLILVARSLGKLDALAPELRAANGITVTTIASDLAAPGAAERLAAEVESSGLSVDGLINNAGVGMNGSFLELDQKQQLDMLTLNVNALTHLTHLLLPAMVKRGRGTILNIASTAAFQPGPFMAIYYATKAYVLHFSEALSGELKGTGVSCTCFCPGATKTAFFTGATMDPGGVFKLMMMPSDKVARMAVSAYHSRRAMKIAGCLNWLLAFSVRFVPRAMARAIARSSNLASVKK